MMLKIHVANNIATCLRDNHFNKHMVHTVCTRNRDFSQSVFPSLFQKECSVHVHNSYD